MILWLLQVSRMPKLSQLLMVSRLLTIIMSWPKLLRMIKEEETTWTVYFNKNKDWQAERHKQYWVLKRFRSWIPKTKISSTFNLMTTLTWVIMTQSIRGKITWSHPEYLLFPKRRTTWMPNSRFTKNPRQRDHPKISCLITTLRS